MEGIESPIWLLVTTNYEDLNESSEPEPETFRMHRENVTTSVLAELDHIKETGSYEGCKLIKPYVPIKKNSLVDEAGLIIKISCYPDPGIINAITGSFQNHGLKFGKGE